MSLQIILSIFLALGLASAAQAENVFEQYSVGQRVAIHINGNLTFGKVTGYTPPIRVLRTGYLTVTSDRGETLSFYEKDGYGKTFTYHNLWRAQGCKGEICIGSRAIISYDNGSSYQVSEVTIQGFRTTSNQYISNKPLIEYLGSTVNGSSVEPLATGYFAYLVDEHQLLKPGSCDSFGFCVGQKSYILNEYGAREVHIQALNSGKAIVQYADSTDLKIAPINVMGLARVTGCIDKGISLCVGDEVISGTAHGIVRGYYDNSNTLVIWLLDRGYKESKKLKLANLDKVFKKSGCTNDGLCVGQEVTLTVSGERAIIAGVRDSKFILKFLEGVRVNEYGSDWTKSDLTTN